MYSCAGMNNIRAHNWQTPTVETASWIGGLRRATAVNVCSAVDPRPPLLGVGEKSVQPNPLVFDPPPPCSPPPPSSSSSSSTYTQPSSLFSTPCFLRLSLLLLSSLRRQPCQPRPRTSPTKPAATRLASSIRRLWRPFLRASPSTSTTRPRPRNVPPTQTIRFSLGSLRNVNGQMPSMVSRARGSEATSGILSLRAYSWLCAFSAGGGSSGLAGGSDEEGQGGLASPTGRVELVPTHLALLDAVAWVLSCRVLIASYWPIDRRFTCVVANVIRIERVVFGDESTVLC